MVNTVVLIDSFTFSTDKSPTAARWVDPALGFAIGWVWLSVHS